MNLDRIKVKDDQSFLVSVALLLTSRVHVHVAVAHRRQGETLTVLHLAFQEQMRSEVYTQQYLCFVPSISMNGQRAIAGFCRRVATSRRNGTIPYGLRYR